MTKILVDKAVIEQALEAISDSANALLFLGRDCEMRNSAVDGNFQAIASLRSALADSAASSSEALAKQAEQEPVAWKRESDGALFSFEVYDGLTPLYAAPVRTKDPCHPLQDLTDDEIAQAVGSPLDEVYLADFRAVIAADREKNK